MINLAGLSPAFYALKIIFGFFYCVYRKDSHSVNPGPFGGERIVILLVQAVFGVASRILSKIRQICGSRNIRLVLFQDGFLFY